MFRNTKSARNVISKYELFDYVIIDLMSIFLCMILNWLF